MGLPAAVRGAAPAWSALPPSRQGVLAVIAAALLWSTGGLFIKWVDLDVAAVTMWRSALAALTIAVLLRPRPLLPPGQGWLLTLGLATSYAVMLLLFVVGTKLTTAGSAIFLQYTAVVHVLWMGAFVGERPGRADAVAVAGAFAGMTLFFAGRIEGDHLAGNLSALGSGVGFALFLVLLRHRTADRDLRARSMVLGNMLLAVAMFAWVSTRGQGSAFTPDLTDVLGVTFLGVVQIGVAYVLFMAGIARVRALQASLIGMLEPVLNPVWVFAFLGEAPGWWAGAGALVILAAVAWRYALVGRRVAQSAAASAGRVP